MNSEGFSVDVLQETQQPALASGVFASKISAPNHAAGIYVKANQVSWSSGSGKDTEITLSGY